MSVSPRAGAAGTLPAPRLGIAPRTRRLLGDYIELTKPKVQSLLLLTTITSDVRRGRPLRAAGRADLPRRLHVGRRRRRDQPLLRPRHRRAHAAHGRSPDPRRAGSRRPRALLFGCALAALLRARALAGGEPPGGGAVVRGLPRLRVRLHVLAEAAHAAEHRDRRRRGRGASARRLGRGDRLGQRHGADAVLHRLLLDAAALLVAVAADEGRVPQGRRADAAGRARRGRDAPADPALRGAAVRGHAAALLRGWLRRDLSRRLAHARTRLHRRRGRAATAARTAARRCGCTCTRSHTSLCCSARWSPMPTCSPRAAAATAPTSAAREAAGGILSAP